MATAVPYAVTGHEPADPESRNEARAVYGGFGVGVALALFIGTCLLAFRGGICSRWAFRCWAWRRSRLLRVA